MPTSREQPPNEQMRQRLAVRKLAHVLVTPAQVMKRLHVPVDAAIEIAA
jgi:hypothetical protein